MLRRFRMAVLAGAKVFALAACGPASALQGASTSVASTIQAPQATAIALSTAPTTSRSQAFASR